MDEKIVKLNDDELENVSGGTKQQTGEIMQRMKQIDTQKVLERLYN